MSIDKEAILTHQQRLQNLKDGGIKVMPDKFEITHSLIEASELKSGTSDLSLAGRIIAARFLGKLAFLKIQDFYGQIQICIDCTSLGNSRFDLFKRNIGVADIVGVKGSLFITKTGEKTLRVESFELLSKSLKDLPEKWHGLSDPEIRYRNRHVDLISNSNTRDLFRTRLALLKAIRKFHNEEGFEEVETPILQSQASGALAKPFVTHHNALDTDFVLRISPETYLKRLMVGGLTKIYEVARCFRNEGISRQHLQEFTMVEGYAAYWNYKDVQSFIKRMIISLTQELLGSLDFEAAGVIIDLESPWSEVSFGELLQRYANINLASRPSVEELRGKACQFRLISQTDASKLGVGSLLDLIYKKLCRPNLIQPTFLVGHPIELSPLARANDADPSTADRFQLLLAGTEIVNAYSELADSLEQDSRLTWQASQKESGDEEAHGADNDFVEALHYGMPPVGGWGFGVDRLLQLLTSQENIKECVFFPLNRRANS